MKRKIDDARSRRESLRRLFDDDKSDAGVTSEQLLVTNPSLIEETF